MQAEPAPIWLATAPATPVVVGLRAHAPNRGASSCPLQPHSLEAEAPTCGSAVLQAGGEQDEDHSLQGKTVLLVLTGAPGRKRVLRQILATGCHVVCYNPGRNWAVQYLPSPEQWILGPLDDTQVAVSCLHTWMSQQCSGKHLLQGVLCYDEYGVQLASILAESLQLPFTSPAVVECMRNKYLFRKACKEGNVPVPRFLRLHGPLQPADELHIHEEGIRFPVIVKPNACAGSFAVLRVDGMQQLRDAVQAFYDGLPAYLESVGLGPTSACAVGGMVVEEMIQGHEVDIDCVVLHGQLLFACVSDNHPPSPNSADCCAFVERGGRCPSIISVQQQTELLHMASRVVGLWGEQLSGVFHLEAFSTQQGPIPIELNARIGGAETWTTVFHTWGVDLAHQAVRIALQLPPLLPDLLCTKVEAAPATYTCAAPVAEAVQRIVGQAELRDPQDPMQLLSAAQDQQGMEEQQNRAQSAQDTTCPVCMGTAVHSCALATEDVKQHTTVQLSESLLKQQQQSLKQSLAPRHQHTPTCSMASSLSSSYQLDLVQSSSYTSSDITLLPRAYCMASRSNASSSVSLQIPAASLQRSSPLTVQPAVPQHRLSRPSNSRDGSSLPHMHHNVQQQQHEGKQLTSTHSVDLLCTSDGSTLDSELGTAACGMHAVFQTDGDGLLAVASASVFSLEGNLGGGSSCSSDMEQEQYSHADAEPAVQQYKSGGSPINGLQTADSNCAQRLPQGCVHLAHPCKHVYSVNFVPEWEGEGVVEVMQVDTDVLVSSNFVDMHSYVKPGSVVRLPPLGFSALGWMVASGLNPVQAEHNMSKLLQGVHIVLRKP